MRQLGFLDFDIRLNRIDKVGDPLKKINEAVEWEIFRSLLEEARRKEKNSQAGANERLWSKKGTYVHRYSGKSND